LPTSLPRPRRKTTFAAQQGGELARQIGCGVSEVDDRFAVHDAESRRTLVFEGNESHGSLR